MLQRAVVEPLKLRKSQSRAMLDVGVQDAGIFIASGEFTMAFQRPNEPKKDLVNPLNAPSRFPGFNN